MRRSILRSILLASLVLASCARPEPARLPAPTKGAATIAIGTELGWPLVAEAPIVDLDGEVEAGEKLVRSLGDGDHYAMFRLDVVEPCGVGGSSRHRRVRVRAIATFRVGPGGGTIGFVVSAGGAAIAPLERRVRARVVRLGDLSPSSSDDIDPVPAKCLSLDAPHAIECRVEARVAHARASRDVVRLNCQAQKLDAIRKELAILDAPSEAQGAPDAARREAARTRLRQLRQESDACLGEEVAFVAVRDVTVVEDTCGPDISDPPPTGEVQGAPLVLPAQPPSGGPGYR